MRVTRHGNPAYEIQIEPINLFIAVPHILLPYVIILKASYQRTASFADISFRLASLTLKSTVLSASLTVLFYVSVLLLLSHPSFTSIPFWNFKTPKNLKKYVKKLSYAGV